MCPDVAKVIRRMAYLYRHMIGMGEVEVDMLLGPFVVWHSEPFSERGLTSRVLETAARLYNDIVNGGHGGNSISKSESKTLVFSAVTRIAKLWDTYNTYKEDVAIEYTFGYYTGILVDLHWPLVMSGVTRLSELYARGLAPEQVPLSSVRCADRVALNEHGVEEVWSENVRSGPAVKKKKKRDAGKKKKKSRPTGVDASKPMLLRPVETETASPGFYTRRVTKAPSWRRIVAKGGMGVSSIRYIRPVLLRGAFDDGDEVVLEILYLFFLGAYPHARYIAPPEKRHRLYAQGIARDSDEYAILSAMSSKEVYCVLSEYLSYVAETVPGIYRMLCAEPSFRRYRNQAVSVCDGYMRKLIGWKDYNVRLDSMKTAPRIQITFEITLTPRRQFEILRTVLKVRQLVPARVTEAALRSFALGPGIRYSMSLGDLYRVFKTQPKDVRIYGDVLRRAGIPDGLVKKLRRALQQLSSATTAKKQISSAVAEFDARSRAVLYLYIHFLHHRSTLQIVPVTDNPPPADIATTRDRYPVLIVCANCYTVRSSRRGYKAVKTVPEGTTLNTVDFGLVCTSCLSDNVKCLSLMKYRVWGTSMCNPDEPQIFTMCRVCNIVTDYCHVVGDNELCVNCYKAAEKSLCAQRCICGAYYSTNQSIQKVLLASDNGKLKLYGLCKKHAWIMQHAQPFLSVGFYRAFL